jgi:hypothetical protein
MLNQIPTDFGIPVESQFHGFGINLSNAVTSRTPQETCSSNNRLVVSHWTGLAPRAALGVTGPEPLPQPDDIVIGMTTGQVIVKGPMTKEEKVVWDGLRARLDECDREIEELTAMLKDRKNKRFDASSRTISPTKSACAI